MSLQIELDGSRFEPGETVRGRLRGADAWPDGREVRVTLRHRTKHLKSDPGEETVVVGAAGRASFALTLPAEAYPTFEGEHFESRWVVEAVVDLAMKRDPKAEADLVVAPGAAPEPGGRPETAQWGGYARFRRFLGIFAVADLVLLAGVWLAVGTVPAPVLVALLAPAVLSLAALGVLAVAGSAVDRLEIALPRRVWRFGETLPVEVTLEAEPDAVAALEATLKGEEVWVTSTGQTTTTHRETIHEEVRRLAGAELRGARLGSRRWSWPVELPLPASGPPSREKDIRWTVRVAAEVPRRPDPAASIDLEVAGRVAGEAR